ncbi:FAD-binding oxidoreductase [Aquisalimonas sp.]|uniref:FAD-binding oxidoreductase n=1 Tax=Aquisalimonas sp. TaxID=1872621 RepID=UPI0025B8CFD9|nr:FAD-binding oxidoreductase [Aquisalimonas sp.]
MNTARIDSQDLIDGAMAPLFETLQASFRGQLLQPGDADYDTVRQIWNGMYDKRPALIAHCAGTADVIAAVNFARDSGMVTAVRGGGHNSAGTGSCDGGLMIDLSAMRAVHVDPLARRARVQGGATWGDFDREAQVYGLATPGGLISDTGVGGLTLAGGMGWLRGKHGLSLDNLASVEIVTADGVPRTASEHENPELFWGVRGGGGNFGVVTSFEFQLHPVGPTVMLIMTLYRASDAARVMRGWRDFLQTAPDAFRGSMVEISTVGEDPDLPESTWGQPVIAVGGVWADDAAEGERRLQPLRTLAAPLADMSGPMPYCEIQQIFDAQAPRGVYRAYYKSLLLNELDDSAIDSITARAQERPSPTSLCSVWDLGGAVKRIPADATAFGARDMNWMLSIDMLWENAADDERNINWARDFWDEMNQHSSGRAYLNFAGLADEAATQARANHDATHYQRLAALKAAYDPGNLFQLNQNIKPGSD